MYGYENTTGELEVWDADCLAGYLSAAEAAGYPVVWYGDSGLDVQVQTYDRSRVMAQFTLLMA